MARYTPNNHGLEAIAQSASMSAAMMTEARTMAQLANKRGKGTYKTAPNTTRAGWKNEDRAGAIVSEDVQHWHDWQKNTLKSVAATMKRRKGYK